MLFESREFVHSVYGMPLYYNGLPSLQSHHHLPQYIQQPSPDASPTYSSNYDFLMSKLSTQISPLTLTPPISPRLPSVEQQSRRGSVIMKVENCQIMPTALEDISSEHAEHLCRWENCYRIFESLEKLANHVGMAHSAIGFNNLYYCKWEGCQRTERGFNARYKMLVHCRTHTKEKPHFCSYQGCTKSFSRAENLKIHFRSHTFEKPYRCSFPGCTKAYSNSSDRFKHRRTHENNKPYQCKVPGCLKRYTDPSSLRKHVKTFNHDSLTQNTLICEDSEMTSAKNTSEEKLYFDSVSSNEHSESNDETYWIAQRDEAMMDMANIKLDQPLDLRIRHT